jgi:hypothetical protein
MLDKMFTIEIQKVGKNRDSVGCAREARKALGKSVKRVAMQAQNMMNITRSKRKTITPIVFRPEKRWGVCDKTSAIPPVDIVVVNHAQVKWWSLSRIPISPCRVPVLLLICNCPLCPSNEFEE